MIVKRILFAHGRAFNVKSVAVGTTVNPSPPAQIRTCRLPAYGSYLECVARKRASG
jgi:hypothetical protein